MDHGFIITGSTKSFGAGAEDVWLLKTDSSGDSVWSKTFGGISYDAGYYIQQTSDKGYIIAGYTESFGAGNWDVWLIKTDINCDTLWTKTFGGSSNEFGESVKQAFNGGYILSGYTYSFGNGDYDFWLISLDSLVTPINWDVSIIPTDFMLFQNYPNPFNPTTTIRYDLPKSSKVTLTIYNNLGQEVITLIQEQQTAGEKSVVWDGKDNLGKQVSSGVYFYQLKAGNFLESRKMVLIR